MIDQLDVYKTDFEAERTAREKIHQEKERIRDECEQLHAENARLQVESTDALSRSRNVS